VSRHPTCLDVDYPAFSFQTDFGNRERTASSTDIKVIHNNNNNNNNNNGNDNDFNIFKNIPSIMLYI
jgi:hypothetical protein